MILCVDLAKSHKIVNLDSEIKGIYPRIDDLLQL